MASAPPATIRVLYVDDEEDICTIVAMALALDPGFSVRTAGSAAAAIAVIADGWRPDIVLVDVMMPDEDGFALLDRLLARAETAAMPVILVTANARPSDLARYASTSAVDVIAKPFDPLALAPRIRAQLAKV